MVFQAKPDFSRLLISLLESGFLCFEVRILGAHLEDDGPEYTHDLGYCYYGVRKDLGEEKISELQEKVRQNSDYDLSWEEEMSLEEALSEHDYDWDNRNKKDWKKIKQGEIVFLWEEE